MRTGTPLTAADFAAIRERWWAGVRAIGVDPAALRPGDGGRLAPALRAAGQPTIGDLAREYDRNRCYISRIVWGKARIPKGIHRRTSIGPTGHHGATGRARGPLTLAEYQGIRAVWRENIRALGLDPDRLPPDFCARDVAGEWHDLGRPGLSEIARRFGASIATVSDIVYGRRFHRDERTPVRLAG